MRIKSTTTATLRYRAGFVRNGVRHLVTPWSDNLILDSGLNKVGSFHWANCFLVALWGDQVGPDPVRRDSSPVTFTIPGTTTCTASGSFFLASDVGRLMKFNDIGGTELYITAFTSATVVTVSDSPTITAETGTIWYVNQTALQSPVSSGNTYGTAGGDNGTSFIAGATTFKRTITGSPLGGPTTLTEIGFSNNNTNVNIFDRDIIVGGIPVITLDQPLVIVELTLTVSPITPLAVGNDGVGFDSSGHAQLVAFPFDRVDPDGTTNIFGVAGGANLEPAANTNLAVLTAAPTVPAYTPNGSYQPSKANPTSNSSSVFTPGIWSRDFSSHFDVGTANGDIFGFTTDGSDGIATRSGFVQAFTASFTKLSTQVLDLTITKNWQRTLVN